MGEPWSEVASFAEKTLHRQTLQVSTEIISLQTLTLDRGKLTSKEKHSLLSQAYFNASVGKLRFREKVFFFFFCRIQLLSIYPQDSPWNVESLNLSALLQDCPQSIHDGWGSRLPFIFPSSVSGPIPMAGNEWKHRWVLETWKEAIIDSFLFLPPPPCWLLRISINSLVRRSYQNTIHLDLISRASGLESDQS